tara:strand:- start:40 stop:471 length:432 start_codon:yes stop_codon:yes gene_type:complete
MSLIKFEVKKEHLMLLKNLEWSMTDTNHILSINDRDNDDADDIILTPFGGAELMLDIGEIIYGSQDIDIQVIGLLEEDEVVNIDDAEKMGLSVYTDEQVTEMTELFLGLATALDICLYRQAFEVGHYKTRYHLRDWKKYEPKK